MSAACWKLGPGALVVIGLTGCCAHPAAPAPAASRPEAWSKVTTEIGEISIPPGWNVSSFLLPDPRAVFYVTRHPVGIVMTAERLEITDPAHVEAVAASFLEHNAQMEIGPLVQLKRDGATTYCTRTWPAQTFFGCAAVRQGNNPPELVFAFATHTTPEAFEPLGGLDLLRTLIATSRDLVPGHPLPMRSAP